MARGRKWQPTYGPAFEPCIPTKAAKAPDHPEWIHQIKHDGYRLIVQRDGKRVRLFTRNGHDWSDRSPLITEAALRNRNSSFVIDGEAVLLGVDGRSDFNGLHSRRHDLEVQFYVFDILVSDGEDLRHLPRSMRKVNPSRLLARRVDGIFLSDSEQGEIGPDLFRRACLTGLEGPIARTRIGQIAPRALGDGCHRLRCRRSACRQIAPCHAVCSSSQPSFSRPIWMPTTRQHPCRAAPPEPLRRPVEIHFR